MRYFIFLFILQFFVLQNLVCQDDSEEMMLTGEISGFYSWENDLYYYGLKFAIFQSNYIDKSYLSPLFEIGGNFGKKDNNTLVGLTTLPGVRWIIQSKNYFFMKFDLLSGLGINSDDSSKHFGNYSEFRVGFGYKDFSLNFLIAYFGGKALSYSNIGLMLSHNF